MNLKLSIASLTAAAVLGSSPLLAEEAVAAKPYTYDMELDIAKVVRIDEPQPSRCKLVRATMTFVNTQGITETVSFLKQADSCLNNG